MSIQSTNFTHRLRASDSRHPDQQPTRPSVAAPARSLSIAQPLELADIPRAMQKIGWYVSAALLNEWFHYKPGNQATNSFQKNHGYDQDGSASYPSDRFNKASVKLDWILTFPLAARVFKELQNPDFLGNAEGCLAIAKCLYAHKDQDGRFDALQACGHDIHKLHGNFQFRKLSVDTSALENSQTLFGAALHYGLADDLIGALGDFQFCAAIAEAHIKPGWRGTEVDVTKVALYMHGPYSFFDEPNAGGSRYLGHWNKDGIALAPYDLVARKENFALWSSHPIQPEGPYGRTFWPVHNADFRRWQEQHNAGGDMILYSDYRVVTLSSPIKIRG